MPNQSTKSAVSTSDAIQAQTGLVNHSPLPLSAQTSPVTGLMVYTTGLLLYPTQAGDKKKSPNVIDDFLCARGVSDISLNTRIMRAISKII